jgi:hypothetical protein
MEKSLWAMMGNNSNFAAVARRVLEMGAKYGTIGVSCPNGGGVNQHFSGNALAAAAGGLGAAAAPPVCAVAQVCARGTGNNTANLDCSGAGSVGDALMPATYGLLDQALTVASSANLDLSGSYYLYIMAALYFAIPAITGQVVLGAKAGTSSLVQGAVSAVAERAGNAAQQGYTGAMASFAASNSHSVAAAAYQGSLLKSGAALQALDAGNRKMDADRDNVFMSETAKGLSRMGQASELRARSAEVVRKFYDAAAPDKPYTGVRKTSENGATRVGRAPAEGDFSSYSSPGALMSTADGVRRVFGAVGGRLGYSGLSHAGNRLFTAAEEANRRYAHAVDIAGRVMNNESYMAGRRGVEANFRAQGYEANQAWDSAGARFLGEGMGVAQQRMGAFGRHQAELAAWEAKNRFASDAASQATILGMNPGSLAPGPKPLDHDGLAMSGQLGRSAQSAASYGYGSFLSESIGGANRLQGIYGTQAYSGMFQQSQGGHFIGFGPNHGFSLSPKFAGDLFTGIVSGAGKKDTYNGR